MGIHDWYWDYMTEKTAYLQTQIGNPEGDDIPNKKIYDPRVWTRKGRCFRVRLRKLLKI